MRLCEAGHVWVKTLLAFFFFRAAASVLTLKRKLSFLGFQDVAAASLDLGRGVGVDHVVMVLGELFLHVLRGMAKLVVSVLTPLPCPSSRA